MFKRLASVVAELEKAVDAGDAEAAAALLERLGQSNLFSETGIYDQFHDLKPELLILLFERLEAARFGELLVGNRHLHPYDFWETVEEVADRFPLPSYWKIHPWAGLPPHDRCPQLHRKFATADMPEITDWLIENIERLSPREESEGTSFSDHQKFMSAFTFIQWAPDDRSLSQSVYLLAARQDEKAQQATASYLLKLPWGSDRQATTALIKSLENSGEPRNFQLLLSAIETHREPGELRRCLWGAISVYDPQRAILGSIQDLELAQTNEERIAWSGFLYTLLSHPESEESTVRSETPAWNPDVISEALQRVDTSGWTRGARGYFGYLLKLAMPEMDVDRVSHKMDRRLISMVRVWEVIRIDHMGCIIQLIPMALLLWAATTGFDWLIGTPVRLAWLPWLLFGLWYLWALLTVRTHFSGGESLNEKIIFSAGYFSLLIGALCSAVLVRWGGPIGD